MSKRLLDDISAAYVLNGTPHNRLADINHMEWTGTEAYRRFNSGEYGAYMDGGEYLTNDTPLFSGRTFSLAFKVNFAAGSEKLETGLFHQWQAASNRINFYYQGIAHELIITVSGTIQTRCKSG